MIRYLALVLLASIPLLAACASAPKPKSLGCEPTPSRFLSDDKGIPTAAVFFCYRDDGVITFASRRLTLEELDALTKKDPTDGMGALAEKSIPRAKTATATTKKFLREVDKLQADVDSEIARLKAKK